MNERNENRGRKIIHCDFLKNNFNKLSKKGKILGIFFFSRGSRNVVVTRQGCRIKKRIGGGQLPRWLPMIPHLLLFTPLYSFLPHCSGVDVCDQ